jgi:hypothetical protein
MQSRFTAQQPARNDELRNPRCSWGVYSDFSFSPSAVRKGQPEEPAHCLPACIFPVLYRQQPPNAKRDSATALMLKGRIGSKGKKPQVSFPWGCGVKMPRHISQTPNTAARDAPRSMLEGTSISPVLYRGALGAPAQCDSVKATVPTRPFSCPFRVSSCLWVRAWGREASPRTERVAGQDSMHPPR